MRTIHKERPMFDTCEPANTRGSLEDYLASFAAPATTAATSNDNDAPALDEVEALEKFAIYLGPDDELLPTGWAGELSVAAPVEDDLTKREIKQVSVLRAPLPAKEAAVKFVDWMRECKITGEFTSAQIYNLYCEFAEADRRTPSPENWFLSALGSVDKRITKRLVNVQKDGKRSRPTMWIIEPPRGWGQKRKRAEHLRKMAA
jgi:hypothetical protein